MNSSPKILVVDDDLEIRELLSRYLVEQGFAVREASNVRQFRDLVDRESFDMIILDIVLPGGPGQPNGSGLEECRALRERGNRTPVILLTAMREEVDRIIGLEFGADDYLGKPFNPRELLARIRAVLRRTAEPQAVQDADRPKVYSFDGFVVDSGARTVISPSGRDAGLTSAEFDVLLVVLESAGRVVSRERILDLTHGRASDPNDRSVDVLVSRIRRKLRDAGATGDFLKTVRNGGYQMTAQVRVTA